MREILFRGKRVDNGEWVYGYFVKSDGQINNGKCFILPTVADFSYGDNGNRIRIGCFVEVDSDTVGQYTGLIDKNGTRIFEGDILKQKRYGISEAPFSVDWNAEGAGWYFIDADGHTDELWQSICNSCTVVGNIHDNPDMLTDKGNV